MKKVTVTCFFILILISGFSQSKNPFEIIRDDVIVTETIDSVIGGNSSIQSTKLDKSDQRDENPFEIDTIRTILESSNTSIFRPIEGPSIEKPSKQSNGTYVFVLLLLSLLLLTVSIARDRKSFKNLNKLISNKNYLKLVNRDINGGKMVFFMLLYLVFLICISLFIFHYVTNHNFVRSLSLYSLIFVIVAGIYLIRHISLFILGRITLTSQLISDYNFLIIVSNAICGLLLFPVVILLFYSSLGQIAFYIGIAAILICYVLRQSNGALSTVADKHTNLFHFFIYICTFEIAPALIILKLIREYSAGM